VFCVYSVQKLISPPFRDLLPVRDGEGLAPVVTLPEGTRLEGFTIEGMLGQGGFGITYLASDKSLDRHVAIKEYFPQMWASREDVSVSANSASGSDYKWGLDSFLKEARILAKFRHPSIVHVNRIIEANGTAYLVLDHEEGADFGTWLEKLERPPTQEELDRITEKLLDALSVVHSNNILHRDIAPDNIKIRRDETPVLLDFGAAREALGQRTGTMTGLVKAGYSPFEQYSSTGKDQGPWTDIYALGATLYRAVTGNTPPEAADRMVDDDYVPAGQAARGEYRESYLTAIDYSLAPRYKDRPQTLDEWGEELFSRTRPGEYKTTEEPSGNRPQTADKEKKRASGSGLKWAAGAGLIGVLGAGGWLIGDNSPSPAPLPPAKSVPEKASPTTKPDPAIQRNQRDQAAWRKAEAKDTINGYQTYLNQHRFGAHTGIAKARISVLRANQIPRRQPPVSNAQNSEYWVWSNAVSQNSASGYRNYLKLFPDGPHAADIRSRLRGGTVNTQGEYSAWSSAVARDTTQAYRDYLKRFPGGLHASDVRARLGTDARNNSNQESEYEAWSNAVAKNTTRAYRDYLRRFPDGLHVSDVRNRLRSR